MAMENSELIKYVNDKLSEISSLSNDTTKTAADFEAMFDDIYAHLPTNDASAKSAFKRINDVKQKLFNSRKDLFSDAESRKDIQGKYNAAKGTRLNSQNKETSEPIIEPVVEEQTQEPIVVPVVEEQTQEPIIVPIVEEQTQEPIVVPVVEEQVDEKTTFDKIKEIANNLIMENEETGQEQRVSDFGDDIIEKAANLYDKYSSLEKLNEVKQKVGAGDLSDFDGVKNEDIIFVLEIAEVYAKYVEVGKQEREDNILAGVTPTDKELKSLSFIDVKAPKKSLRQALDSNDPKMALMNNEDLLVANKYFVLDNKDAEDKAKCKEKIDEIMADRLRKIVEDGSHISPDNAVALMAICAYCTDPNLRDLVEQAKLAIKTALENYDKDHFGNLSNEAFLENYEALHEKAGKYNPFEDKDDELSSLKFKTSKKDKNGVVTEVDITDKKEIKKHQDCLLSVARELAVQKLAKEGNVTEADLNKEIKNQINAILAANVSVGQSVNVDRLAAVIAVPQVQSETFKARVCQKFKNTKLAKKVTSRVDAIDKKLTETYGDTYVKAKKVIKFAGKLSWGVAKNSALYAGAALVPGGTAVLLACNVYKSWKNLGPQLEGQSKVKKLGLIAATAVTTGLSVAGIGAGLGLNAQNFAEAGAVSPEAVSSVLTNISKYARMGIVTGAMMFPNALESVYLKIKQNELKNKLKQVDKLKDKDGKPLSDETKAKMINEIMQEQKRLKAKQGENLKEMATKGVGVLGGMACAQFITPFVNEQFSSMVEKAESLMDASKSITNNDVPSNSTPSVENSNVEAKTTGYRDFSERPSPLLPEEGEKFEPEKQWESMQEKFGFKDYDGDGKVDSPWSNEAEAVRAEAEGVERTPDDVAGKLEAEHKANLDEAKVAGSSGLGKESSYDHTLRHLENLNDSRIENNAQMAENLCEHFGDKANLATIACKMAPYALQAELGLDLPEGVNPTSYQMLDYISEHELTPEQQAKFDQFIEKNFDGVRFKTENFPDWSKPAVENTNTASQTPPQQETKTEAPAASESKTNNEKPEVKVVIIEKTNPITKEQIVIEQKYQQPFSDNGMTPQDRYAAERGYVPCPAFSRGLDYDGARDGTFRGYYGTYINPETGKVLYLPNDMVLDQDKIVATSIGNARDHMEMAARGLGQNMYNNTNGSYYGYGTRHMYPGGLGPGGAEVAYEPTREQKFWNTLGKINAISQTITGVAHDASHVSHDISHVIHDIKSWGH